MFKRVNNWHLSALIVIVSTFSLILVQGHVQAQWSGPGSLPGDTPANNLVVNPMLEDLELNDYRITGDNIIIDPDNLNTLSIDNDTDTARLCLNEDCRDTWPTVTAGEGLWDGEDPGNIYYNGGKVGIGTTTPSTALEVFGFNADESNLKLQNPSGDMRLIFQEYFDPPTAYGDISIRYNGIAGGYNNWLEFWGGWTNGNRPVMTMQRDYSPTNGQYSGVGIGVEENEQIDTILRVKNHETEDIFQLYDDANEVFSVADGGAVNIGGGLDHSSVKLSINDGGSKALKLDFDNNDEVGKVFAFQADLNLIADYDILLKANKIGVGVDASAPGYPLHIADNGATAILNMDDGGTFKNYFWTGTRLERDNVEKWFIGMDDIDKGLKFRANSYIDSMVLDSDNSATTLSLSGDDTSFFTISVTDSWDDTIDNVGINFSRNEWKTDIYTDYSMSVKYGSFYLNSYYEHDDYGSISATPLFIKDIGASSSLDPHAGYVGINNIDPLAQMHVYNDRDGGIAIYGQAASSADGTYAGYFDGHVGVKHTSGGPYNYIQMDHLSAGATPPLTDCDDGSEKGRMIYDYSLHKLYICDDSVWMGVLLKP